MSPGEAAAHWRVRHDAGTMTDTERDAFDRWLGASPSHGSAWARADQLWDLFDQPGDQHLQAMRSAALATDARPKRPAWMQLAAGFAVVGAPALAILAAYDQPGASGPRATVPAVAGAPERVASLDRPPRYETKRGERLGVTLSDGTAVTLNTDSAIEVAFEGARRTVRLTRGQALFDVAKDARRPFVVAAAGREVTALGTVFDVRLDASSFKVLLVEGRVAITKPRRARSERTRAVLLRPGQGFIADLGEAAHVATIDTDAALLWREGLVELEDVTLAEAVSELNRYSPRQITIRDPELTALRVSGVFRTGAPERFVRSVGEILPISARPTENSLEIVSRRDAGSPPAAP